MDPDDGDHPPNTDPSGTDLTGTDPSGTDPTAANPLHENPPHTDADDVRPAQAPPSDTSPLEGKYRRLLRLLPRAYRAAREEEMVATFLESSYDADPDNADLTAKFGSPGWGETVSVIALALRLRWADPHAPARYRTRASALRIFTLTCLAVLAADALVNVTGNIWLWAAPPPELGDVSVVAILFPVVSGWWAVVSRWAFLGWLPALACAARGSIRGLAWAIAAAVFATGMAAVSTVVQVGLTPLRSVIPSAMWVLVQLAAIAGLTAMRTAARRGAAPAGGRRWLIAAGTGFVTYTLATATVVAILRTGPATVTWNYAVGAVADPFGMWAAAAVVGVSILWWRGRRGTPPAAAAWLGLAWFALAATLLHASTLTWRIPFFYQHAAGSTASLVATLTWLAITAAVALGSWVVAARLLGRMPVIRYSWRSD